MGSNIGFISTRFAGTDGVSLEAAKWAQVLGSMGHTNFWYAGQLDRDEAASMLVSEAFFGHEENVWIDSHIWGSATRPREVTSRIRALAETLKESLYAFVERFDLDVVIPENALAIPMHVPLGLAVTEFLSETGLAAIGHHHDFSWERTRFSIGAVPEYLDMAFPPRVRSMRHVVINQSAQEELAWRKGLPSTLVPNVFDFDSPPPAPDDYARDVRSELGYSADDIIVLQPTRVVPRKGIEHAIELVRMIGDPRYKLLVSHEAGDEGLDYLQMLERMASEAGVDMRLASTRVRDTRQKTADGTKLYTLWDLYPHADLITYPSLYEGFGNAFLEAVYFRKPVVVNRYSIYVRDIEPLGFRTVTMDGYLTAEVAEEARRSVEDAAARAGMADHNYEVARRHFSFTVLRRALETLLAGLGMNRP